MGCGCSKIVSGVVGLTKAGLQTIGLPVDQAPADVVARRRDVCRACPHASRNMALADRPSGGLTTLSRCDQCGCYIAAKTLLASESCPLGLWS